MELRVSHEQSLSSSTPVIDNIFDKYNKNLVPIRSLSDHDTNHTRLPRAEPWDFCPPGCGPYVGGSASDNNIFIFVNLS